MEEKIKKYELIESYGFIRFPMREMTVEVVLQKNLKEESIRINYNAERLNFDMKDNVIYFQVDKNGKYRVEVANEVLIINIKNIIQDAPELVKVYNNNNYLDLQINGNNNLIDYTKSFVLYQGEKHLISNDNTVRGEFTDKIQVILFDQENNFISYNINLLE